MNLNNDNKINNEISQRNNKIQVISTGSLSKVSRIAEGTYGIIYEAKNENGSYAVKRMKIDRTTNFVGSVKELDFLARMKGHPFIVELIAVSKGSPFSIYNGGSESPFRGENASFSDDRIYLISEKAAYDGSNLVGKTNIKYCKMIMLQSLLALEYMHGHHIMHRDIKPSNLLWFRNGFNRTIKFCDFGISKNYTSQEKNSCFVFTPIYRAPEVFMQISDYDYTADIWSLGCVFYELLSGKSFLDPKGWTHDNINSWDRAQVREIYSKIPELPSDNFTIKGQIAMSYTIPKKVLRGQRTTWDYLLNLPQNKIAEFDIDSKYGTYDNFKKLLNLMLKIDPSCRCTAKQAIDHPFFKDYVSEIKKVREMYPPTESDFINPRVRIINSDRRKWMRPIIEHYYNTQNKMVGNIWIKNYSWYQDRILFQAIDIYDRFILYYADIDNKNKSSSNKEIEQESSNFCFMVCLYISIKYFLTTLQPCSFKDLVDDKYITESSMESAESFEFFILNDVLKFNIYRPTIYETAEHFGIKTLTSVQVGNLLSAYLYTENIDCSLFDLYKKCAKEANINIVNFVSTAAQSRYLDLNNLNSINNNNFDIVITNQIKPINATTVPTALGGSGDFIHYNSGSISLKHVEPGNLTTYGPRNPADVNNSFINKNNIKTANVY